MNNYNIDNQWSQMLNKNKEFNTKLIDKIEKKNNVPLSYIIWDEKLNKELKQNDLRLQKIEINKMNLEDKYAEKIKKIKDEEIKKTNEEIKQKNNEEIKDNKTNSLINYLPNFVTQYFI
jgi:hypothetical protein